MNSIKYLFFTILFALTVSCQETGNNNTLESKKPDSPSSKAAQDYLKFKLPAYLQLQSLELEENEIEDYFGFKFKATLTAKEDLYSPADDDSQIIKSLNQYGWSENALQILDEKDVNFFTGAPRKRSQRSEKPPFVELAVQIAKGDQITFYGNFVGNKTIDKWSFDGLQIESGASRIGAPIGAYPENHLALTEKNTQETLKKFANAQIEKVTKIKELQNKKRVAQTKLEELKKESHQKLVSAVSPGSNYLGIYSNQNVIEKVVLNFEKMELDGDIIIFKISSVAFPDEWARYRGKITESDKGAYFISAAIFETLGAKNDNRDPSRHWRYSLAHKTMDCKSLSFDSYKNSLNMVCRHGSFFKLQKQDDK